MKKITKVGYTVAGIGAVVVNLMISGTIIAGVRLLGWWAFPAHFGLGMLLSGIVLVVLLPPKRKGYFSSRWAHKLSVDERRFSRGVWPWIRKRGSFALVLAANFLVGPFFAALVIRFLGLSEQKSWMYAFVTTFISTTFWVSVYLGGTEWVRTTFLHVF